VAAVGAPDDSVPRFFGSGGRGWRQDDSGRSAAAGAAATTAAGRASRTTRAAGTEGSSSARTALILTNNHVVEDATKDRGRALCRGSGHQLRAKVIGRDPLTDSALIQLIDKPNHCAAGSQVRRLVTGRRPATG
jgi:serine protease Do